MHVKYFTIIFMGPGGVGVGDTVIRSIVTPAHDVLITLSLSLSVHRKKSDISRRPAMLVLWSL